MLLQHPLHEGGRDCSACQKARWSFSRRVLQALCKEPINGFIVLNNLTHILIIPISLFGFLSGAVFAGATVYYYILGEYRVSNEMLTEDIYVRFHLSAILSFVFFIIYRF